MKNLIYLLLICVTLISCSEEKVAKRINWTSESQQAIQLFEEFLKINEFEKDMPEYQEKLMDSILSLDSNFVMAKTFYSFGTDEENRQSFMSAYENIGSVSDIEKRLIEANYQRFFNGNRIVQDSLVDELIIDYPEYYQLRLISGDIKNNIDVKGCQERWKEALEINSKSFSSISVSFIFNILISFFLDIIPFKLQYLLNKILISDSIYKILYFF